MLKLVGVHFRRVGGEQGGGREHRHVQLKIRGKKDQNFVHLGRIQKGEVTGVNRRVKDIGLWYTYLQKAGSRMRDRASSGVNCLYPVSRQNTCRSSSTWVAFHLGNSIKYICPRLSTLHQLRYLNLLNKSSWKVFLYQVTRQAMSRETRSRGGRGGVSFLSPHTHSC